MSNNNQSETIGALAAALARAQGSLNAALKDSQNPHLKNKYADLASIWTAAREPLAANELAVIQTTDDNDLGQYLVTTLAHSSGEWIRGRLKIGTEGTNKGVNPNQALGSSISYMRRYALAAIVGVIQDDDDGNASSGNNKSEATSAPGDTAPDNRTADWQGARIVNPLDERTYRRGPHWRRQLIGRIQKGEDLLVDHFGMHDAERTNSRQKHLKTTDLAAADADALVEFLEHLQNKYAAWEVEKADGDGVVEIADQSPDNAFNATARTVR